jgi:uncharacterized protein
MNTFLKINILKTIGFSVLMFCYQSVLLAQNNGKNILKNKTVLVYTKNGKGYVHDNIPAAVACIQRLGKQYNFKVEVSDTPSVFTRQNLQKYTLLIFTSTNNDVFDTDSQRLAFRQYIEAGGGLVGIHSIMGTERNWTWFKQLIGGSFAWHPHFQPYKIKILDTQHPSVKGLPKIWDKEDECYFEKEMYPGIHTIMVHDISSLKAKDDTEGDKLKMNNGSFGRYYPAVWYQNFDGGICWITTLGHAIKDYQDPTYIQHIWQGIQYVASKVPKIDFSKAYATDRDSEMQR